MSYVDIIFLLENLKLNKHVILLKFTFADFEVLCLSDYIRGDFFPFYLLVSFVHILVFEQPLITKCLQKFSCWQCYHVSSM